MSKSTLTYTRLDDDDVDKEIANLNQVVKEFCKSINFPYDRIEANIKTLEEIVIRVHKRKVYFHFFHDEMEPSQYKVTGLYVFWILKLRPFWVSIYENDDENEMDIATRINEHISLYIVLSLIQGFNKSFIENGQDLLSGYIEELLYSFRYRDISKEALYLMLDPFYFMQYYNEAIDEDGISIL